MPIQELIQLRKKLHTMPEVAFEGNFKLFYCIAT